MPHAIVRISAKQIDKISADVDPTTFHVFDRSLVVGENKVLGFLTEPSTRHAVFEGQNLLDVSVA